MPTQRSDTAQNLDKCIKDFREHLEEYTQSYDNKKTLAYCLRMQLEYVSRVGGFARYKPGPSPNSLKKSTFFLLVVACHEEIKLNYTEYIPSGWARMQWNFLDENIEKLKSSDFSDIVEIQNSIYFFIGMIMAELILQEEGDTR